jgi:hypothetical protein
VETILAAVEATEVARLLRTSRWGYGLTNAAHILGIALLVGSTIPLQLRFLGLWRGVPRQMLVRVLSPMAATGLALAVIAGGLLFSVRAREYADIGFLQAKLVLVVAGLLSALALHRSHGALLDSAGDARLRGHAALSIICWIGALICGRMIAFTTT